MKRAILAAACLGLLAAAPVPMMADRLAGKWNLTITPTEHGREFKDTLSLTGGQLSSAFFAKKGFKPVVYDEDTRGIQVVTFKAAQESEKEGTLDWNGQVTASGELDGDLKWTHKDGKAESYKFKGERAQDKK